MHHLYILFSFILHESILYRDVYFFDNNILQK